MRLSLSILDLKEGKLQYSRKEEEERTSHKLQMVEICLEMES